MMTTRNLAALLVLPLMMACAPGGASDQDNLPAIDTGDDSCGAADYQQFVGQKSPQISVPADTAIRHYRSGDPVTLDMRPDRINFEYDRNGVLVKVSCG